MRKITAALQISVDGFIQGADGEQDWVDAWDDPFRMSEEADACVLGGVMYQGYEQYWTAVMTNPDGVLPFSGKKPNAGELKFAAFARRTPHYVLSTTLGAPVWPNTTVLRDIEGIRTLKDASGRSIYAMGGAGFVSSLMNAGLIDEVRTIVHPVVLGKGKSLFEDVTARHQLKLLGATPLTKGMVQLNYSMAA